jgi:hypothetical protein
MTPPLQNPRPMDRDTADDAANTILGAAPHSTTASMAANDARTSGGMSFQLPAGRQREPQPLAAVNIDHPAPQFNGPRKRLARALSEVDISYQGFHRKSWWRFR